MSISSMMNTTISIYTGAVTKDAGGFNQNSLVLYQSNVPARVSDMTPNRAMIIYGSYNAEKMKRVGLNADWHIVPTKHWFLINGNYYVVTSIQDAGGELHRCWFADVLMKPFGN